MVQHHAKQKDTWWKTCLRAGSGATRILLKTERSQGRPLADWIDYFQSAPRQRGPRSTSTNLRKLTLSIEAACVVPAWNRSQRKLKKTAQILVPSLQDPQELLYWLLKLLSAITRERIALKSMKTSWV